ncbi:hypothetical protein DOTSEDRAFT_52202 [Dothistroma septosporum NZE10]|uniref:Uncharacterized protein n=1 Tax=Dothistroma septosporum (strain NZE10 / CBS 128990) TaxID=675120 RepID=N1PTR3_DOTSN|nr:hypothetical protein DOTSEDRAFT_52202 [Dothistroma septosporum NZE10]
MSQTGHGSASPVRRSASQLSSDQQVVDSDETIADDSSTSAGGIQWKMRGTGSCCCRPSEHVTPTCRAVCMAAARLHAVCYTYELARRYGATMRRLATKASGTSRC